MKKTKQEKAITLIALIITIIILLILAIVTINAIQGDDGLITKANNAAKKYKDAASEENSLVQKYLAMMPDEDIKEDDTQEEDIYAGEVPDNLKKYILGEDLQGRLITEIVNIEEETFIDESDTITDASTSLSFKGNYYIGITTTIIWVEYNSSIYRFDMDGSSYKTIASSGVKKIGNIITPTSKTNIELGSIVSYDGEIWTVMYINGNDIQMISNNALKYDNDDLCLGYKDTYLTKKGTLQGTTNIEKAICSYNNAITTLNNVCNEIVTKSSFIKDVRCVGSNPNNKNSESESYYTSEFLQTFPTDNPGVYNGVAKKSDTNSITDIERLLCLGKTNVENDKEYFMASREIEEDSNSSEFELEIYFYINNVFGQISLLHISNSNFDNYLEASAYLRPVVTIDATKCNFSYDYTNEYFTLSEK